MNLNQKILKDYFSPNILTVATKGVETRSRPSPPLQLGVSDPEQILETTRKIKRSQSSPALCNPDQLDISSPFSILKEEEQDSSWLKPTIPVSNFQVLLILNLSRKQRPYLLEKSIYFTSKLARLLFNQVLVGLCLHLNQLI